MRRFLVWALVLGTFLGAVQARAQQLLVVGDDDRSAYSPVWHAILKEAGLTAQFVTVQRDQRRRLFVAGRLVADCCAIPAWRQRPEEKATQIFTDPFFYAVDHVVVRANDPAPPKLKSDLRTRRVATVIGYDYVTPENLGTRVEVRSMNDALAAVAAGRADATIINLQEFMRLQRADRRPLAVGIEYGGINLRARVHKARAGLVPRLNAAIHRLRKSGKVEALVGAGIRGHEREGHARQHP